MPIAALLLDLDGTLVDSEPVHFRAHEQFLASVGVAVTAEDLHGNIGKGDRQFYIDLAARAGKTADPDAWVAAKDAVLLELFRRDGLAAQPGAQTLVAAARAHGIARSVVTNSGREMATLALECAGLAEALPARICHEDTFEHKPHPAPYLLAAQRLSISTHRCVAIEDSVSGVRAAVAAGCRTIAVAGLIPVEQLLAAGAHRIANSLSELLPWDYLEDWMG